VPKNPAHKTPECIESRSVDALIPYARNARTHSDAQVAQIAASIREFGWTTPLLISADGTIIAGHGRLAAARKLGMVEVPCIVLDHLSETQRRALVLADNKLALNAGWDDETLAVELAALRDDGFDLSVAGFIEQPASVDADESASTNVSEFTFQIIVECDDEAHQGRIMERLEKEGYRCRPLTF
jgi:hypothetical protein